VLDLAAKGVTANEAAQAIYGVSGPSRNQRERARRRLERLADDGRLSRQAPIEKGGSVTYWLPIVAHASVIPMTPRVTPLTHPPTRVTTWLKQRSRKGSWGVTRNSAPPLRGAGTGRVTSHSLSRKT
jgi:hypothetical protein